MSSCFFSVISFIFVPSIIFQRFHCLIIYCPAFSLFFTIFLINCLPVFSQIACISVLNLFLEYMVAFINMFQHCPYPLPLTFLNLSFFVSSSIFKLLFQFCYSKRILKPKKENKLLRLAII